MSKEHYGPHCAGYCEGAAYQIEIRNLRAENAALREAIKKELQCAFMGDYGHMHPCRGWDDRLEEVLYAHGKGDE